ncbi:Fc.00g050020.m01.CDS01 [Cosmosporella sp. VM-42]
MASAMRTFLAFQHNAKLHTVQTVVTAIRPFNTLEVANRDLFRQGSDEDYAVVTEQTVFHPQGGGQPSDVGVITDESGTIFTVAAARMDTVRDGQVLHFGRFNSGNGIFREGDSVNHSIDVEKRLFYSRLHTAGHVLGAAVRSLLEKKVENFDELKASHFPESAACEFQGLIEGKWKGPIQEKVDEYIKADMPVEIDWWDEEDFRRNGVERLIPDAGIAPPGEKFRVVKIVGAETYPCGGTHVDTTELCGPVNVKKISRSKGNSRVSYAVK